MTFSRAVIIAIVSFLLESCASHHYALIPPPGNTSWTPDEQSAIVLVGLQSDELIGSLLVAGEVEGISLASNLFPRNELNVVAVHFRSGEEFRLVGASFLASTSYATHAITFDYTRVLEINSPGVYFYGTILTKGRQGYFDPQFNEDVITRARQVYPAVFTHLQPVNF